MISPTYGKCADQELADIVLRYIKKGIQTSEGFNVIIGTDSQNFSDTKAVVVLVVQNIGKGGIFFYDIKRVPRIDSIRQKLLFETKLSLQYADKFLPRIEDLILKNNLMCDKINFCIHIDAGWKGKTNVLIPEVTAWIDACGYQCEIKPNSFAASSVADKLSK